MKKTYVKPELFYESFVLSQHIAGCQLTINSTDVYQCTASGTADYGYGPVPVTNLFTSTTATDDGGTCDTKSEAYCYTNGSIYSANINS